MVGCVGLGGHHHLPAQHLRDPLHTPDVGPRPQHPSLLPMQVEEGTASGAAALHLAAYLFYSHSFERTRNLLEKQLGPHAAAADPEEALRVQALLGFVLLEQQAQEEPELQDSSELHHALQLFDGILAHDQQDLEVMTQISKHTWPSSHSLA